MDKTCIKCGKKLSRQAKTGFCLKCFNKNVLFKGGQYKQCKNCKKNIRIYNIGDLCQQCRKKDAQCNLCGKFISKDKKHICSSVDIKGTRYCHECGKELSNVTWERYSKLCGRCGKKEWRKKEKEKRIQLIKQFGNKCSLCGYDKHLPSLHFHHTDSSEKYLWTCSGKHSIREIEIHPERFMLICANCHGEITHPV